MPPALPEQDSASSASDPDQIPYRDPPSPAVEKDEAKDEAQFGDKDDEEGEEYVVEKIMSHRIDSEGTVYYEIKWVGYDKKADRTWEPEENLDGAMEILQEYLDRIGGRPEPGDDAKPRKGKRKQSSGGSVVETKAGPGRGRKKVKLPENDDNNNNEKGRKGKGAQKWEPPKGTWDEDIISIDSIEETYDEATKENKRVGYVMWNVGKKTKHNLQILNHKCPQKLLQYYEQHLVFRNNSSKPSQNGGATKEEAEEGDEIQEEDE